MVQTAYELVKGWPYHMASPIIVGDCRQIVYKLIHPHIPVGWSVTSDDRTGRDAHTSHWAKAAQQKRKDSEVADRCPDPTGSPRIDDWKVTGPLRRSKRSSLWAYASGDRTIFGPFPNCLYRRRAIT